MSLVGYCRVSTSDQNLDLQRDALNRAGCDKIFVDVASGGKSDRVGLNQALAYVRGGDTLVVWRLDRLGRSIRDLIELINALKEREVGFQSLHESLDTTTSGGQLVFHVFAALAEFERSLIRERTQAGLKSTRARGRMGGRPRLLDSDKVALAHSLLAQHELNPKEVCRNLGISRATLYRYLGSYKQKASNGST